MILFTKDVFLNLKNCTAVYVQAVQNLSYGNGSPENKETWQVVITGHLDCGSSTATNTFDLFTCNVQCTSKDDAYRSYKDIMQQVVDSGCYPDLNTKLIDEVLKEK